MYRGKSGVALPGLLVALAAGCADEAPRRGAASAWQAAVDTIGDTVVVRTISGSVWGAARRLVAEVTIGVLEGPDEYMFGDVLALNVGRDGRVYVLDGHGPVLRMYAPDGSWVRNIGREGGGPGEYSEPDGGLGVFPDGRILLRDPGNGRFTLYTAEGEYIESWPLPSGGGFNTSLPVQIDTAGRVYTLIIKNLGGDVTEWEWALARLSDSGGRVDTLAPPDWDFEPWVVSGRRNDGENRSSSMNPVPYAPGESWAMSPFGHFVGGLSTNYRIDAFRGDGRVLRIEKHWEPVPVDREESRLLERRVTESFARRFPGWTWNGPPIPDAKPAFASILTGVDGRLWIRRHTRSVAFMTPEEARAQEEAEGRTVTRFREPVEFDVFEPDGRYLGRVLTPDDFRVNPHPVFRGDTVWAVTADALEVNRVARFRLEP